MYNGDNVTRIGRIATPFTARVAWPLQLVGHTSDRIGYSRASNIFVRTANYVNKPTTSSTTTATTLSTSFSLTHKFHIVSPFLRKMKRI